MFETKKIKYFKYIIYTYGNILRNCFSNYRVLTVWLLLTPVICELFDCLSLIKGVVTFLGGSGGGFLGGSGGGWSEDTCATILQSCQHINMHTIVLKQNT